MRPEHEAAQRWWLAHVESAGAAAKQAGDAGEFLGALLMIMCGTLAGAVGHEKAKETIVECFAVAADHAGAPRLQS